jgi:hypothetical protein
MPENRMQKGDVMKRTVFLLCVLVFTSIGQANAESGDHFWLLKGGLGWRDAPEKPDALTLLGLTYGYGLTQRFALEFDYDHSIVGGAYNTAEPEKGEYDLWLASANVAYRHLFVAGVYLKAKAGYSYGNEARSSDKAGNDDDGSVNGISGNIGLGYLAGPLLGSSTTFELSYTWYKQDITSAMLGINLTF